MSRVLRAHRHFLAAPVFAVLVTLSALQGSADRQAMVLPSMFLNDESLSREVMLTHGVQAVLFPGARGEVSDGIPRITDGSILVSSAGLAEMTVGGMKMFILQGAAHITVQAETVTVAALTAPLLVDAGGRYVLIPAGMQWRGNSLFSENGAGIEAWQNARKITATPAHFTRKQFQHLLTLSAPDEQEENSSAFNREQQDLHDDVQRLISSIGQPDFARLLVDVTQDERLWLLTLIHPDFYKAAWALPVSVSPEAQRTALFVFPQADRASEGFVRPVYDLWLHDALAYLHAQDDAVVHAFGQILQTQATEFRTHEYPLRSQILSEALGQLHNAFPTVFSQEDRAALQSFLAEDRVEIRDEEPASSQEEHEAASSTPEQVFSPDVVQQSAEELLQNAGAVFTVQTVVTPEPSGFAHITNIVFATAEGDTMVDFTLDTVTGTASHIALRGEVLPYRLSLERLVAWLRE